MPDQRRYWGKHARWSFRFADEPGVNGLKGILGQVIAQENAKLTMHVVSRFRVDCVWPKAVTYRAAGRLITIAKRWNVSFDVVGPPMYVDMPGGKEEEEKEKEKGAESQRNHLDQSQEKSNNKRKRGKDDKDHSSHDKKKKNDQKH